MSAPVHTVWEYATLQVDWTWESQGNAFTFVVTAMSDEHELFTETIRDCYWSKPLSRMGRMGWELVGLNPQNVLAAATNSGYENRSMSVPVRMAFFFKRPLISSD